MPFADYPSLIKYKGFCGLQTLLICFWFAVLVLFFCSNFWSIFGYCSCTVPPEPDRRYAYICFLVPFFW